MERAKGEAKEHQNLIKMKIADRIPKKYEEIDLFGKRPSEKESSIY